MTKTNNTKNIDWKYAALIFSLLILWASSYVGIRYSLQAFSAENLAFLRYLTASIGFAIAALFIKIKMPLLTDLPRILLLGLTGFSLYNLLLNFGERTVSAGVTSFIINTVPFFTLFFVIVQKQEKTSKTDLLGLLIAFSGVFLIIVTTSAGTTFNYHTLYILGAALCQALYFSIQKKFLQKYSPIEITSYAVWSGTLVLFFFSKQPFYSVAKADWSYIISVLYLGLLPGMIAYLIVAYSLRKYKTSNVSSYLFFIPFITLLIGWIILNEIPSIWALMGGILIVSGVIIKNKAVHVLK